MQTCKQKRVHGRLVFSTVLMPRYGQIIFSGGHFTLQLFHDGEIKTLALQSISFGMGANLSKIVRKPKTHVFASCLL